VSRTALHKDSGHSSPTTCRDDDRHGCGRDDRWSRRHHNRARQRECRSNRRARRPEPAQEREPGARRNNQARAGHSSRPWRSGGRGCDQASRPGRDGDRNRNRGPPRERQSNRRGPGPSLGRRPRPGWMT
jgi:hypothetical protein